MKKLLLLGILLFLAAFIIGCSADVQTHLTANQDGSAQIENWVLVDKSDLMMVKTLKIIGGVFTKAGYSVSYYEVGPTIGVSAKKQFKNSMDYNKEITENLALFAKNEPGLQIKRGFFLNQYKFNGLVDLTNNKSTFLAVVKNLKIVVTLPAKLAGNNGGKLFDHGKTVQWMIAPGQKNELVAEAVEVNWLNILWVVLGMSVVVGALVWGIEKKRKKAKC